MKLKEFIKKFSHNNIVRLLYEIKGGHELVLDTWNDISMDWEIVKLEGKYKDYVRHEVLGLASIAGIKTYAEAINIIIER